MYVIVKPMELFDMLSEEIKAYDGLKKLKVSNFSNVECDAIDPSAFPPICSNSSNLFPPPSQWICLKVLSQKLFSADMQSIIEWPSQEQAS